MDKEHPIAQSPDGELITLSEAYELVFGAGIGPFLKEVVEAMEVGNGVNPDKQRGFTESR